MGQCFSPQNDETLTCFEKLKSTPFAFRFEDEQLMEFAVYWTILKVNKGQVLEGLPTGDFYVVVQGDVDLLLKETIICHKTRGDTIGIPQDKDQKNAKLAEEVSAIARTAGELLQLTPENLETYLTEYPSGKDKILPLMSQSTKRLAKVECFEGIPTDKLSVLNMMFRYVVLKAKDTLFKEESLGSSLYVVLEGTVQAVARIRTQERKSIASAEEAEGKKDEPRDSENPKYKMLHQFATSEIFGEISLIMDIPRTAAILATTDALLLELTRHSFQSFMKLVPDRDLHLNRIIKVRIAQHFRKYKVPFFASIADEKYAILASHCDIVQFSANTTIFKEGDVGHEFYMIAHGEVKVTVKKEGKNGQMEDLELTRMGPGMYFGEIALVQETPRTATITTVKRSVLLSISKSNFEKFFNEAPEAIADFEIKLARYNVQLRSVMYHPVGLEYFTKHVKAEFSEENIEFWKECRDYRHLTPADVGHEDGMNMRSKNHSIVFVDKKQLELSEETSEDESDSSSSGSSSSTATPSSTSPSPASSTTTTPGSPVRLTPTEKKLADYNAAFEIYAKNDILGLADFKKLMELVGLNSTMEAEELENLMVHMGFLINKTGAEIQGKILREQFIRSLLDASKNDRRQKRKSFACVLLWKLCHGIVSNEISKLHMAFDMIDTESTGKISFYNFQNVLKQLGYELTREKMKKKFDEMDKQNTGEVNFEEFVRFMINDKRNKDAFKELLKKRATFIYNEYVSPAAPRQVNIQGPTRKKVKEDIEGGIVSLNTFDKAEQEILALLSTDTFARFKQSQLFQQFLDAASSYTHVRKSGEDGKGGKGKDGKDSGGKGKKNDLRPKHFRGSSLDVREAEAEKKKKEEKLGITHSRADSIGIDALMKTLGTDDLFAIHVGGQGGANRTRGSSDTTTSKTPSPYKPTIGVGLDSLSEEGGDEEQGGGGGGGGSSSASGEQTPSSASRTPAPATPSNS